jgi:hypothetical protein
VDARPFVVGALELRSASNPLSKPQGLRHPILPFVRDGQLLSSLGAAPLQNDSAVLCCHAHTKPMRLGATPGVRLERALTLFRPGHTVPDLRPGVSSGRILLWSPPVVTGGTVNTSRGSRMVSTNTTAGFWNVLESPVPVARAPAQSAAHSVSSPRFPQLWKTLWKTTGAGLRRGESGSSAGKAGSDFSSIFLFLSALSHGRQHLGPDPRPDRDKG